MNENEFPVNARCPGADRPVPDYIMPGVIPDIATIGIGAGIHQF
jgi:hypothetical protein